jgi:hypothetical protein
MSHNAGEPPAVGLPSSTSLDTDETPFRGVVYSPPPDPDDFPTQAALDFRHSGWVPRREATRSALIASGQAASRLERFDRCGARAWVIRSKGSTPIYRLACDKCRDRFCEACASEKRLTVCRNLRDQLPDQMMRLVTFTLLSTAMPLSDQIDRIYGCFKDMRGTELWRENVTGGLTFLELTRNVETGLFHPHLHVLTSGKYLPQKLLRQEWLKITGDSYIVDVRAVDNPGVAAGYVAKYAGKSVNATVWRCHDALVMTVVAMAGRRTFNAFGSWRHLSLARCPSDDIGWEPVAPLHRLITKSAGGDVASRKILHLLRGVSTDEPIMLGLPAPPTPDLPGVR